MITKWLILILFVFITLMGSTSANETKLPEYSPEAFERIKNNPEVIDIRGNMPNIEQEEEKRKWMNSLCECGYNLVTEIEPYMLSNSGPVVGYSCDIKGCLMVVLDKNLKNDVDKSLIDEIYHTINTKCEGNGISAVPVVFMWGETPTEDSVQPTNLPGFTLATLLIALLALVKIKLT